MMRCPLARTAVAVLLLAACESPPASRVAGPPDAPSFNLASSETQRVSTPLSLTASTCTGAEVTLTGQLHVVTSATANDHTSQLRSHVSYQHVHGVDADGTRYVLPSTLAIQMVFDAGGLRVFTSTHHLTLVSQGSTPNLLLAVVTHLTYNANGEPTVDVRESRVVCTG